ncbi:MAG: hypothetical protein Q3974_00860 [Rothia sp. (in: high G+C Gram-positive bacteria)]|nr:hypothetical protein [Rothia sp. (in: high G+C Gram-positive bacteria)]
MTQIEMQRRKESGYLTGRLLGENEVFYTPTTETSLLMEKIQLNEVFLAKLAQEEETLPHTVEELRSLYDELLEGELEKQFTLAPQTKRQFAKCSSSVGA